MPQDTTHDSEENLLSEDTTEETPRTHIPEPAKKTSKFGLGQFQTGSKFGKGNGNFNPPNKQRPGRAAGRGR